MANPLAQPRTWDLVADAYAVDAAPHLLRYAMRAWQLAELPPRCAVIDVACGAGDFACQLAADVASVAAIDFAPAMIAKLTASYPYGLLGNIDARVGDGQQLPWADATFDGGFSIFGLMFFDDRVRGLSELRRVVRPGGKVAITSWLPLDRVPALHTLFGAIAQALPGFPFQPSSAPLGDEPSIRHEFTAAGFVAERIAVHQVSFAQHDDSFDALWARIERTLAPLVALRDRLGAAADPIVARARAVTHAALGDGPQTIDMPAWISIATV